MTIDPEKQTRYWRSRCSYPRPSAGEANDGSGDDSTDESCSPFKRKAQQFKTLVNRAEAEPSWRHRVADWTPPFTQEHDLESPLKRSVTWNPDYAPWNTNRRRASQNSTQTDVSYTTSSSDDSKRPSLLEGTDSDEFLDPRSPYFNFTQQKPTAADHFRLPLDNANNNSPRTFCSLADSLKSPLLSMEALKNREAPNIKQFLELRRSRVLPSPFPGLPVQRLADTSTAVASGGTGKLRKGCFDARLDPRLEASEKRAERLDQLAVWVVAGLVGVWVLLVIANLRLAGYEAALKAIQRK
ncbi:uncharacterized protein LY79DRAFT_504196 [Colletotrichum navitas]|uniref:Uncharacterized protein n=1 Tax=Colletotrichum navitas TaxID=681940 RepID=A0AAD8VDM3_9PEZI|nr:uncharacterized protein LY79DRAFT_504196 [Colletotrichum navitas]KAK1600755.1 hypothetical protein LY79DRAFT_504196 [Colletotrichum navitas]